MSADKAKSTPAPLETGDGNQQDDNIDDLGRRYDGAQQDQPVESTNGKPHKDDQAKR
ncbi:hypothetical protein [Devosia rhizoryzae]|uniref:Uncharacterized protein n=1 Tax=Devosia rhizoryzae TaxID=2774137 RepID=A0ABX7C989_9HYPH|nr:hypothetical protein [Devosia rhizoryzae]QQR40834.1 hypothetical protein JI748_07545 [Devosia rhizoryzae]